MAAEIVTLAAENELMPMLPPKEPTPTGRLVAQVVAAGGSLTTKGDESDRRRLQATVHAAQRYGKAPAGKQLVVCTSR